MSLFVVDASVAAKWILPGEDEPYREEAIRLLERYVEGEVRFLVPDLFWPELANILWKCSRVGRIDANQATTGLKGLRDLSFPNLAANELIEDALEIALITGRTVYDSLYVAAAISRGAALITADERLVNGLGARFPVRWLGAIAY